VAEAETSPRYHGTLLMSLGTVEDEKRHGRGRRFDPDPVHL